jgi:hypothetical protein
MPASGNWLEAMHTGWWLHEPCVETGRQVACVRAAASVVEMQHWRSASARGRNGARLERRPGVRVQASDGMGRAKSHRRGLGLVLK